MMKQNDDSIDTPDYPKELRKQLVDRFNQLRIPAEFFTENPMRAVAFFHASGILWIRDLPNQELELRVYKPKTNLWI